MVVGSTIFFVDVTSFIENALDTGWSLSFSLTIELINKLDITTKYSIWPLNRGNFSTF